MGIFIDLLELAVLSQTWPEQANTNTPVLKILLTLVVMYWLQNCLQARWHSLSRTVTHQGATVLNFTVLSIVISTPSSGVNLVLNLGGCGSGLNKIDFFRQFHKKFQFFLGNFRKISIFSGNFTLFLDFLGKIGHLQLLLGKSFYFFSKVTTFEHTPCTWWYNNISWPLQPPAQNLGARPQPPKLMPQYLRDLYSAPSR